MSIVGFDTAADVEKSCKDVLHPAAYSTNDVYLLFIIEAAACEAIRFIARG